MTKDRLSVGPGARPRPAALPSPLRTIREVAQTLAVCERTVRRLIARGELASHQVGRAVRVAEPDLRAYLAISRSVSNHHSSA